MKNADHLTQGYDDVLAYQIDATRPGQASWACTGPLGMTCGDCALFGYLRRFYNEAGDLIKVHRRRSACAKFFALTGCHGPNVPAHAPACRYFQRSEGAATNVMPEVSTQATGGLPW